MPSAFNAVATRETVATSSACETRLSSLFSPRNTSESAESAPSARDEILREVETRIGKPAGAGHLVAVEERPFAALANDAAKSHSAHQNASRSSVDHRHSAA
jgi:hypothetical protein